MVAVTIERQDDKIVLVDSGWPSWIHVAGSLLERAERAEERRDESKRRSTLIYDGERLTFRLDNGYAVYRQAGRQLRAGQRDDVHRFKLLYGYRDRT